MTIKSIDAVVVTSTSSGRKKIFFDDLTGLITEVKTESAGRADFIFSDDCLLFAGMGDIHIHAREDVSGKNTYKEDFHSACCAALNGGVVHVADMPNNPVPPIDDESYLEKVRLAAGGPLPILMYAGIGPLTRPLSFRVPYKAYMGPSVGDLFFKTNEELENVLAYYQNQHVSFHCEDPQILEASKNESDHFTKRPLAAEIMATDFALYLIEKYHLKGKLCHYSAGEGLLAIKKAKDKGLDVSAEVTPQHLYFTEEKIRQMSKDMMTKFQMNPPIRGEADRLKLLQALKVGLIDYLATDHAPHSPEEKAKGTSGLTGLDTYGAFMTWLMAEEGVDPTIIARTASENPGRFFNQFLPSLNQRTDQYKKWGKGMGLLEPGYSASFTILNLKRPWTVTLENIKTKARWSPFLGVTFPGSVESVFLHGKKVS